jgi:outer membrane protein assembly factor BamB
MTSLLPFISKIYQAPVWRMEIDENSQTLFLEISDHADKQVSFSALSLQSGDVYFEDLTTPERWLTGIEAVYDGVLLLHNYQSATGPVHKGITAIEATTGKELWSNFTLAFDHLSVNGPIVYNASYSRKNYF